MHVKILKVFCDVVGRRSFSRAADENGISQSGASQMVHQLEEHLGVKLIDRSKRPFVLTAEGEVYYEGCRKIVARYFSLEDEVRNLHQEVAGRVSVASIYSVGLAHMSWFVQEFQQLHPKASVRIEYRHPSEVYAAVENDQVDLGLVSYPKMSRTIKAIPWRQETMVLACAPHHPLATRRSVKLADLNGVDLVSFVSDLRIRREIDRALDAAGVEFNVLLEFDNIETIKRAIEIGNGVALLPEPTVQQEVRSGALVAVPLSGPGTPMVRPLGIVFRQGKELGRSARRFIQLLQDSAHLSPSAGSPAPSLAGSLRGEGAGQDERRQDVADVSTATEAATLGGAASATLATSRHFAG